MGYHVAWGTEEASAVLAGVRNGTIHYGPDAEAKAARAQAEEQFFDVLRRTADWLYKQGVAEGACAVDEAINRLLSSDDD